MHRIANAVWKGSGPEGSGTLTTTSGALTDQPFSAKLRFQSEDGKAGTNPEELIAAAHAGCFSMALSGQLGAAGMTAERIDTCATVTMDKTDAGFTITAIHLDVAARIPGAANDAFQAAAIKAKEGCPVSRVLNATITMDARLES